MRAGSSALLYVALLLADSLHLIFARLLLPHISPSVSAMYVLAVAALEVGAVGLALRQIAWSTFRRHLGLFLAIGALVAASTNINYEAMAFIDPGTGALLSKTSVPFGVALGLIWLGERMSARQFAGAAMAAAGAFAIAFQSGDYLRLGSVMVVASSFMYALHMALAKRYAGRIRLLDFFFLRLLCTTGFLFAFAAGRGALQWPSGTAWGLLVLTGTVDVALSRVLYYAALRRLRMSVLSIVLTVGPVVTVLWAMLLFGSVPTAQEMAGGAGVLVGVFLVARERNRRPAA